MVALTESLQASSTQKIRMTWRRCLSSGNCTKSSRMHIFNPLSLHSVNSVAHKGYISATYMSNHRNYIKKVHLYRTASHICMICCLYGALHQRQGRHSALAAAKANTHGLWSARSRNLPF